MASKYFSLMCRAEQFCLTPATVVHLHVVEGRLRHRGSAQCPRGRTTASPPSRCPHAPHASSRFIFPTTRLGGESQFSDFLDGLGPAQIVGRQTLATPPMGESSQGQGEWGNGSHAAERVSSAGALRDAMQAAERSPHSGFCASEEESACTPQSLPQQRGKGFQPFSASRPAAAFPAHSLPRITTHSPTLSPPTVCPAVLSARHKMVNKNHHGIDIHGVCSITDYLWDLGQVTSLL